MTMQNLQNDERVAFEKYLLAGNDEGQIKKSLEALVEGSAPYYYLYFLNKFKTQSIGDFSQEDQDLLDKFTMQKPLKHSQWAKQIRLRSQLLNYDNSKLAANERVQIITNILSDHLHGFDFDATKQVRAGVQQDSESSQDEEVKAKESVFDETLLTRTPFAEHQLERLIEEAAKLSEEKDDKRRQDKRKDLSSQMIEIMIELIRKSDNEFQQTYDFTQVLPSAVYELAKYSSNVLIGTLRTENETIFTQIAAHIKYLRELDADEFVYFHLESNFVKELTIQQMDKLAKLDEFFRQDGTFVAAYFQKQFSEELSTENQEIWTSEEKLQNLERLYGFSKSQKLPKEFQLMFLTEILQVGPKVGKFNEDLFREYIDLNEKDIHIWHSFDKKKHAEKQQQRQKKKTNYGAYISNVRSTVDIGVSQISQKYLTHFCEQNKGSLAAYAKDFSDSYLQEIETNVRIYQTEDGMKSLDGKVSLESFKQVSEVVHLKFDESNKENFEIDEEVELKLNLKNIQQLHVKLFEFNTETYYKKNLAPFNTSVNLDGLEAKEKSSYEYTHKSNIKFSEVFKFPQLQGKIGLFIVEFVGNGVSGRAVIKKGQLSLVHRSTIAGHLAYIINQKKEICHGERTGVYFDNKFYAADKDNGRIFIPYGQVSISAKIIMIHNDFAQLGDFTRKNESYSFSCKFYINQESLLVGASAKLVVIPQLKINGRKADLKMLKNSKVVLTTKNYIDNIPVTKNFAGLSFEDGKELSLQFQVPPNLGTLAVNLTTEVQNATKKKMEHFTAARSFGILTQQDVSQMADIYLRKIKGEYHLVVLGKNGEPRDKKTVNVSFGHRLNNFQTELKTDKNGFVKLGKLVDVKSISAEVTECECAAEWNLENQAKPNTTSYSHNDYLELLEGEDIDVPFNLREGETELKRKWFGLIWKNNGVIVEDWFNKLQLVHHGDEATGYNSLKVEGLQAGEYDLQYIDGHQQRLMTIKVNKGEQWEGSDGFILKKNCLQENIKSSEVVRISKVELVENNPAEESKAKDKAKKSHEVNVWLDNYSSNVHVHAFATQFIQHSPNELGSEIDEQHQQENFISIFSFAQWKNLFLSDRQLSDEIRYVFDRKQMESQLGNTLDRPTLLMKRNFTQKTTVDDEVLASGDQFQMHQEVQQQQQYLQQNCMPSSFDRFGGGGGGGGGGRRMMGGRAMKKKKQAHYSQETQLNVRTRRAEACEFENFLKCPPVQLFNLKPEFSEEGDAKITFEADLAPFTQLFLVVVDKNSVAERQIDLKDFPIQKRDLRLNKHLNESKGLTESRITLTLAGKAEDGHPTSNFIEDITSSEVQLVDDLTKVQEILKEIRKISGGSVETEDWKKFEFVFKWLKYSKEEKDRYLSEYTSYELHLFIQKKDPGYFSTTVKPFLQCKMEKKFFDYYLLKDFTQVLKYTDIHKMEKLNTLELCLLIDVLVQSNQNQKALMLATKLRLQQEADQAGKASSVTFDNKIFDLVLNLNTLNDVKGDLAQLQDKMKKEAEMAERKREERESALSAPRDDESASSGTEGFGESDDEDELCGAAMVYDEEELEKEDDYGAELKMSVAPMRSRAAPTRSRKMAAPMQMKSSARPMMMKSMQMSNDMFESNAIESKMHSIRAVVANKQDFEELEATSEYMETHYYKSTDISQFPRLITRSQFWVDYAHWLLKPVAKRGAFLTSSFTKCATDERVTFLAITLMDLPFTASEAHKFEPDASRGVNIQAGGNLILFKKEIKEADLNLKNDVMVIHRYQKQGQDEESESGFYNEFLTNTNYNCEVIVTNVSPKKKQFSLLYQIPQGSMPMFSSKYMKSVYMTLDPYTTKKETFSFYFPVEGTFKHFPSNITVDQIVNARGGANTLKVVKSFKITKIENFNDLLQAGSNDDILNYLKTESLYSDKKGFSFYSILYLLKDKEFFEQAIEILRARNIFHAKVWSYAFFHKDNVKLMREALMINRNQSLLDALGTHFESSLITVDESFATDGFLKHLEYHPMVNTRTHKVGKSNKQSILNVTFRNTYDQFLTSLIQKKELTLNDQMIFVYYLQLQDRVNEAIELFNSLPVLEDSDTLKIQYDYLKAYFDFFTGAENGYTVARRIVQKYDNYPVSAWKMMFLTIEDQLNEFDGEFDNEEEMAEIDDATAGLESKQKEQKKTNLKKNIKREPNLSQISMDTQGTLTVESVNIKLVKVKYYIINAELLFSRAPFLKDNTEGFSYVMPFHTESVQMVPANADETQLNSFVSKTIPVPEKVKNKNLVIEISGEGHQEFKTFYSNQLKVNTLESYGELKVVNAETGKGLSHVYCKVFASHKNGSKDFFFRDGYTDIRGKFEYSQTSGDKLKDVKRFAILVQSDNYGSKILECNPPKGQHGSTDATKGTASLGLENQQVASKYARLQNRQMHVKGKSKYRGNEEE